MQELSTRSNRRRRLIVALALVLAVIAVVWWTGAPVMWARSRARQALAVGHLDEAEQRIQLAIRLSPREEESQLLLARIQRKQGRMREFEQTLKRAVSVGLSAQRAQDERILATAQAGGIDEVQPLLDRMLVRGIPDGRETLESYVNGCLKSARLEQAAVLIDGWESTYPLEAQPNYYRGRLLMFYGQQELAESQFRKALSKNPEHAAAAYLLSRSCLTQNRPQEALDWLQHCQAMQDNAAIQIQRAKALRSLGRADEARSLLEQVVQRPSEEIEADFQRVGERYEGAPAQLELGSLESEAGRYDAALKWLDVCVQANPHDLAARNARGIALRGVGRNAEAAEELQAVRDARSALREVDRLADSVDKNPALVEERVRIGELYLQYESKLTGEFWLKSALSRDPQNRKAHELLANLYDARAAENPAYQQLADQHRRLAAENTGEPASTPSPVAPAPDPPIPAS